MATKTKQKAEKAKEKRDALETMRASVQKALDGNSNDAEHDALVEAKGFLDEMSDKAKKAEETSGRKNVFIMELAEFIAGNQARKSIELQMGKESAKEWAKLRGASPVFGYGTVDEAYEVLVDFLK